MRTEAEALKFLRENYVLIDDLVRTVQKHKATPLVREQALLWVAGLSAGQRQAAIIGDWGAITALAWSLAVKYEGGDFDDPASVTCSYCKARADEGIACPGCRRWFCDNCYDTEKGDGCHCHPIGGSDDL